MHGEFLGKQCNAAAIRRVGEFRVRVRIILGLGFRVRFRVRV